MSKAIELSDSLCRMDTFTEHQRSEILKAASELRRLAAIEQAIKDAQPLTDEQIKEVWRSVKDTGRDMHDAISFARAIEAAHGIKETP
jgi:hypothetical protein